ncbi:MAG: DinB family protein [Cyclobacteriaceae bacterium]
MEKEFVSQSVFKMKESLERVEKCLGEMSEEEVWKKPNSQLNSAGNLVIHLCGNITQYIISSIGNEPDNRERDGEFSISGGFTKAELISKLRNTVEHACKIIAAQEEPSLLKLRSVQGYELTGIGIIIHVVEHFSYHTGQIAFWVKLLKEKDLGFYAGKDLNQKNKLDL